MRDTLTKIINAHHGVDDDAPRDYIGASSIGSECLRQIWYQYKGFRGKDIPKKIRSTWDIGKHLEGLVVKWLVDSDVKVLRIDVSYECKTVPKFRGHIDALVIIDGINCILEIKTAKDASFKVFVKKGVRGWNPQYYAQIQSYMGMSGIKKSYILVLNKDNSELSDELVEFDADFYDVLCSKASMIQAANVEPPRINGSALFYKCKMCNFNSICHE